MRLAHPALLYHDAAEHLAGTTAFVRSALDADRPVLVGPRGWTGSRAGGFAAEMRAAAGRVAGERAMRERVGAGRAVGERAAAGRAVGERAAADRAVGERVGLGVRGRPWGG